jgi:hypothetical protein
MEKTRIEPFNILTDSSYDAVVTERQNVYSAPFGHELWWSIITVRTL